VHVCFSESFKVLSYLHSVELPDSTPQALAGSDLHYENGRCFEKN